MLKLDGCEVTPSHYERKKIKIKSDKKMVDCEIYIANPNKIGEGLKPTKEYLRHLLAGRKYLSDKYIQFLESIETGD